MIHPWKLISAKTLIHNKWIHLIEEKLMTHTGGVIEPFYKFKTNDWALVIAQTKDGQFVLVRQYRRGIEEICLEFPAGALEEDEDPVLGIQRELLEETGYASNQEIQHLGTFPINSSNQTGNVRLYFLGEVERRCEPKVDPTEEIDVVLLSIEELVQAFQTMEVTHPIHHLAWHRFQEFQKNTCL